eukprot:TRINITY_DN378_c0_g1_i1.p1 TRINITY_DN378_c0_g1~~TRINITY_DN378_c0_g1_i1.p1  ORF type:complete len:254 (+),score=81.78 TRINITY_DN378_c0_g1_i1:866-1627(+)
MDASGQAVAVAHVWVSPNTLWMLTVAVGVAPALLARFLALLSSRLPPPKQEEGQQRGVLATVLAALACRVPLPARLKAPLLLGRVAAPARPTHTDVIFRDIGDDDDDDDDDDGVSYGGRRRATLRRVVRAAKRLVTLERCAGAVLAVAGLLLAMWAERAFEASGFTPVHGDRVRTLFTGGPFAFTRNPIYVGAITFNVGLSLLLDAGLPLVLTLAWWGYVEFHVIPSEETALLAAFGDSYKRYMRETSRWLFF